MFFQDRNFCYFRARLERAEDDARLPLCVDLVQKTGSNGLPVWGDTDDAVANLYSYGSWDFWAMVWINLTVLLSK
jgi:hypothetical protein